MKVLLGQTNTTPGNFTGNVEQILVGLAQLCPKTHPGVGQVDLAVFPELSIPGYLSKDLMFQHRYVENNLIALRRIVDFSNEEYLRDVAIVVGYIDTNKTGIGKPFRNMLAVIRNGAVIGEYQKHLLPFYDVFDEGRYFEPGKELLVLNIGGTKVGFCICEDVWNDKDTDGYDYQDNPIEEYRKRGITTIVNISSSPFVAGKPAKRLRMLEHVTSIPSDPKAMTMIYVNQHGGQDDLVFDGHSCVIRKSNTLEVIRVPKDIPFKAIYKIVDTESPATFKVDDINDKEPEQLYKMIVMALHDYIKKSGFNSVVLGSSGGIDSAVVAALACEVVGPKSVNCIMMPSIYSSPESVSDAQELHKNLGCREFKVPIDHTSLVDHVLGNLKTDKPAANAEENIQARIRGMMVMYFSNGYNALALTTGNKTELATGYCTLYGDMNGGFAPISDLYKMQVYALARYINEKSGKAIIPLNIINKAPSAELAPGQTDEASLLPYPILDVIVRSYVEQYIDSFEEFRSLIYKSLTHSNQDVYPVALVQWTKTELAQKQYERIIRLINVNEFKRRQAAPGIKLSRVAFGSGRRLPICKEIK